MWKRILLWLKKKHRKVASWKRANAFSAGLTAPLRGRWRDEKVLLRQFADGGTQRYRRSRRQNTERMECRARRLVLSGTDRVLGGLNPAPCPERHPQCMAAHGEPDAGKLACPVRRRDGETDPRNGIRRAIPTLRLAAAARLNKKGPRGGGPGFGSFQLLADAAVDRRNRAAGCATPAFGCLILATGGHDR